MMNEEEETDLDDVCQEISDLRQAGLLGACLNAAAISIGEDADEEHWMLTVTRRATQLFDALPEEPDEED